MDEIIARLKEMDEENVTREDYEEIGHMISQRHIEAMNVLSKEDFFDFVGRTDRLEDALLAGAEEDKRVDVSQCILLLRGRKDPDEVDLPIPGPGAYENTALENTSPEFRSVFEKIMQVAAEAESEARDE